MFEKLLKAICTDLTFLTPTITKPVPERDPYFASSQNNNLNKNKISDFFFNFSLKTLYEGIH